MMGHRAEASLNTLVKAERLRRSSNRKLKKKIHINKKSIIQIHIHI